MTSLRMSAMKTTTDRLLLMMALFTLSQISMAGMRNSPVDIVKARNLAVEKILAATNDDVDAETKEELKEVINGFIDFRELSRLSLGKYWKKRTEQEKRDFVNVFSQLIKRSSVKKLEIYKADSIVYEQPEIAETKAKVTTVAYKGRKEVEIQYKMHKVNEEWLVYDMVIDGVSTARNYRDSFYKQIAKSSYKEMYDKLVKKLAKS